MDSSSSSQATFLWCSALENKDFLLSLDSLGLDNEEDTAWRREMAVSLASISILVTFDTSESLSREEIDLNLISASFDDLKQTLISFCALNPESL